VCIIIYANNPTFLPMESNHALIVQLQEMLTSEWTKHHSLCLGSQNAQTVLPIIEDTQNNAKGFTSRILWYFPEPVFCKMAETRLSDTDRDKVKEFTNNLGKSFA